MWWELKSICQVLTDKNKCNTSKSSTELQTKNPMPIFPIKTKSQNKAEGNCLWGFSEHLGYFLGYHIGCERRHTKNDFYYSFHL